MITTTLKRAAALAHALDAEARRLRRRADAERKVGPLRFPDDITRDQAEAAFGPMLSEIEHRSPRWPG